MHINAETIEACKKGNPRAQQQLYNKTAPFLLSLCTRYAPNKDDAEDILIEGFVKVFNRINDFDETKGSFHTWAKKIITNVAIDYLRVHSKVDPHCFLDIDMAETTGLLYKESLKWSHENSLLRDGETHVNIEYGTDTAIIIHHLKQMPDKLRIVFNLRLIEDYSYLEIEELLQVKQATLRSRYSKALAWINQRLNPDKQENIDNLQEEIEIDIKKWKQKS